jgi:hypothetical protein
LNLWKNPGLVHAVKNALVAEFELNSIPVHGAEVISGPSRTSVRVYLDHAPTAEEKLKIRPGKFRESWQGVPINYEVVSRRHF